LSRVIVLGATNRIDLIDPSILRPGRFGVHIPVGLPDAAERKQILEVCLRTRGSGGIDAIVQAVVPLTEGYSGATLKQLCDDAKRAAIKRTNFTKVAAPTVADMREAIDAQHAEKKPGDKKNG
jgi:SpoVK/Ycf46/Vps4 family AAA+-type ATPase